MTSRRLQGYIFLRHSSNKGNCSSFEKNTKAFQPNSMRFWFVLKKYSKRKTKTRNSLFTLLCTDQKYVILHEKVRFVGNIVARIFIRYSFRKFWRSDNIRTLVQCCFTYQRSVFPSVNRCWKFLRKLQRLHKCDNFNFKNSSQPASRHSYPDIYRFLKYYVCENGRTINQEGCPNNRAMLCHWVTPVLWCK